MNIKEKLKELCSISGLSANESLIAKHLCNELTILGLNAEIDCYGNVHGIKKSAIPNSKTILLEAHLDQIGLMVSGIDENGYIKFVNLGGVDERILPGMKVEIQSKNPIIGIIGSIMPDKAKEEKNHKIEALRIDTGMTEEEAKKKIKVGDLINIQGKVCELICNKVSGPAMDNRSGVLSILLCLEKIKDIDTNYNIHVLFSTQEELGLHGAYTGAKSSSADAAIVVDVTHGTTPDTKDETGVFPLGCGAVICRGPNLHYEYSKQLIKLAKDKDIPYVTEVASGGSGTTAWAMQVVEKGIPVMLVSIPLKYMHTNVETLQINDIEAVAELLYYSVKGGITLD